MFTLKARAVGNSTGVTLPREVTDRLKIKKGDSLYLTESPDGNRLTSYNPEFERQMGKAEAIMRRYKDALRQLRNDSAMLESALARGGKPGQLR